MTPKEGTYRRLLRPQYSVPEQCQARKHPILQPGLAKFRGLYKQGLVQAAHTFGFLRSLNLVRAPIHSLIDCVANTFR
jgi:hypothetical protein